MRYPFQFPAPGPRMWSSGWLSESCAWATEDASTRITAATASATGASAHGPLSMCIFLPLSRPVGRASPVSFEGVAVTLEVAPEAVAIAVHEQAEAVDPRNLE